MKKSLTLFLSLLLIVGITSSAQAFSHKNPKCSICHQSSALGLENFPKKLVLPDSDTVPVYTKDNTLTSAKVDNAPIMDGKGTDTQWSKASSVTVKTKWLSPNPAKAGTNPEPEVTLKSLYTKDRVYILASWADTNPNQEKDLWEYKNGVWTQNKSLYDEDRLAIQWDNNVAGFARVGCAITCHSYTKEVGKYTNNPGEKLDLWHWKSTRTMPLNWTDDGSVVYVSPDQVGTAKGRKSDSGDSGEAKNEKSITVNGATVKVPKFMFDPTIVPGYQKILTTSNAVYLSQGPFAEGTKIPGVIVADSAQYGIKAGPSGSRGDVETAAYWSNGRWTLEISRLLNTGNSDDSVFVPYQKKAFGLAIFNNNTDFNHSVSSVLYLDLAKPVVPVPPAQAKPVTKPAPAKIVQGKVTAKSGLHIRVSPSTSSKKIGTLKYGNKVTILAKKGNWYLIKTNTGQGYVYASYIKLI